MKEAGSPGHSSPAIFLAATIRGDIIAKAAGNFLPDC
jgi:hypothetical protein